MSHSCAPPPALGGTVTETAPWGGAFAGFRSVLLGGCCLRWCGGRRRATNSEVARAGRRPGRRRRSPANPTRPRRRGRRTPDAAQAANPAPTAASRAADRGPHHAHPQHCRIVVRPPATSGETPFVRQPLVRSRHHTLIHQLGFSLVLHPDRRLELSTPDGTACCTTPPRPGATRSSSIR